METKTGQNLCNLDLGKNFLGTTPKAQPKKQHNGELNSIKLKCVPFEKY